jgi:hypothetical protein
MAHAAGVVSRFSDVNDGEAITPRSINPWIEGRSRGEQPGRRIARVELAPKSRTNRETQPRVTISH